MLSCNYTGTYIGKEICGFKQGHIYQFELNNDTRTYELNAIFDETDGITVDLVMRYASEISIRKNWNIES